jgi:hypothetical protein
MAQSGHSTAEFRCSLFQSGHRLIAQRNADRMPCFGQLSAGGAIMQFRMAPWAFVLAVPDIKKSAEYFRDVLGFRISWENGTDWRLAERDNVRIMLGQCPTDIHPNALGSHNWFG